MARGGGRAEPLDVWLYRTHLATLTEPKPYRYRLEFTAQALDRYGVGSRILSLSLPMTARPTQDRGGFERPVGAFVQGLLPEGTLRANLASEAGVARDDVMALLRIVGRECAGAVQFLSSGDTASHGRVRNLSAAEVETIVSELPTYHLPEGSQIQASLAGIQDKILLVEQPHGWGLPEQGAISTHIVKPEPRQHTVPDLIDGESWALEVAAAAGLPAAKARLEVFGSRKAIVVTRYDRGAGGQRIHQEDFTQALGLDPEAKYESASEGDRLRRLARLAAPRAQDPARFRQALLAAVTFNLVVGNADAHSKNFSLLIDERGAVQMAPLYDTAPVMFMDRKFTTAGHVINGRTRIDYIERDDLIAEAEAWGTPRRLAADGVDNTIARIADALSRTVAPTALADARRRLDTFWQRKAWLADWQQGSSESAPLPQEKSLAAQASRRDTGAVVRAPTRARRVGGSARRTDDTERVWVEAYTTTRGTQVRGHWRARRGR